MLNIIRSVQTSSSHLAQTTNKVCAGCCYGCWCLCFVQTILPAIIINWLLHLVNKTKLFITPLINFLLHPARWQSGYFCANVLQILLHQGSLRSVLDSPDWCTALHSSDHIKPKARGGSDSRQSNIENVYLKLAKI